MSVVVGTLTIDLNANTASFSQSMDKMSQLSAKTANDIKRSLEKIAAAGLAMGAAIATGTAALIIHALDAADSLGKLASSAGTTSETLSVLNYAAHLSNVSTEELGKGLEKLSKSAFAAQNGNQLLANTFSRLGINVTDSNGHLRDSGVVFGVIASKFAGMQDGAGKTALAMTLFGKSGAALIPLLNQYGSEQAKVNEEAHQFGLVLSTSTSDVAQEAHDNLDRLKSILQGMGFALLGATLPALKDLSDKLIDIAKRADIPALAQSFGAHVVSAINLVGNSLVYATQHAKELKIALEALAALQLSKIAIPIIADLANGGFEKVAAGLGKFVTSGLGITKLIKPLSEFAGWLKYSAQFVGLLASTEGVASAATYVLGAGFAAIGGWVTVAIAAIAGVAIAIYKFRDSTFSLKGEQYELRDVFSAAWIGIQKVWQWAGTEFGKLVEYMQGLWRGLVDYVGKLPFVDKIISSFQVVLTWAQNMLTKLGNLTPKWITDLLDAAKQSRLAAPVAAPAPTAAAHPKNQKAVDTANLVPKKDLYGDEIRKLDLAIIAQTRYIAVLDATPDKIAQVSAAISAETIILDLNKRLTEEGRAKLDDHQKAVIRQKVAFQETLKAIEEYGKELVGQQHSAELSIIQTQALTESITKGDQAVRDAVVSNAILAATYGKTADQIKAMQPELDKLHTLLSAKSSAEVVEAATRDTDAIRTEIESRAGLVDALLTGEDAFRQASLATKLYSLDQDIAVTSDKAAKDALIAKRQAIVDQTKAEYAEADAREAVSLQSPLKQYNEETDAINRQIDALTKHGTVALGQAETLAAATRAQEAFNKATDETVKLLLAEGTAKDGVTAFFLKMQEQAQTTASIVFNALNSAFDKLSDNLAKLITGGKTSFGEMFTSLGEQLAKSTIQQQLQKGLGALGGKLGISLGGALGGKPDGSANNPWYVKMAGGNAELGGGIGGLFKDKSDDSSGDDATGSGGIFSKIGKFFKGGGSSGDDSSGGGFFGVLSHLFGGFKATGGSVSPDKAYIVGDQGPELLFGAAGSIASSSQSSRMLGAGGSGGGMNLTVDARGTDPALSAANFKRGLQATRNESVNTSFRVVHEYAKRTPK